MMAERGVEVDHTTIMRWVHQYSPEIEKKVRRYLKSRVFLIFSGSLHFRRIMRFYPN
jgi:transposase-like protein